LTRGHTGGWNVVLFKSCPK